MMIKNGKKINCGVSCFSLDVHSDLEKKDSVYPQLF